MKAMAKFTSFIHDTPLVVDPKAVAAVDGNYIHLHGEMQPISVKEDHDTILERLNEAMKYAGPVFSVPSVWTNTAGGAWSCEKHKSGGSSGGACPTCIAEQQASAPSAGACASQVKYPSGALSCTLPNGHEEPHTDGAWTWETARAERGEWYDPPVKRFVSVDESSDTVEEALEDRDAVAQGEGAGQSGRASVDASNTDWTKLLDALREAFAQADFGWAYKDVPEAERLVVNHDAETALSVFQSFVGSGAGAEATAIRKDAESSRLRDDSSTSSASAPDVGADERIERRRARLREDVQDVYDSHAQHHTGLPSHVTVRIDDLLAVLREGSADGGTADPSNTQNIRADFGYDKGYQDGWHAAERKAAGSAGDGA